MSEVNPPNRIAEIPTDQLSEAQAAIIIRLMNSRGRVPTPFKIWLHSPVLADHLQALGEYLTSRSTLTTREVKIVILFTAVHWHADYVFRMHAREARGIGLPEDVISALGSGQPPPLMDPREQIVYALLKQSNGVDAASDAVFDSAIQALGHAGVSDLLGMCGYFSAVALATKLYRVT